METEKKKPTPNSYDPSLAFLKQTNKQKKTASWKISKLKEHQ